MIIWLLRFIKFGNNWWDDTLSHSVCVHLVEVSKKKKKTREEEEEEEEEEKEEERCAPCVCINVEKKNKQKKSLFRWGSNWEREREREEDCHIRPVRYSIAAAIGRQQRSNSRSNSKETFWLMCSSISGPEGCASVTTHVAITINMISIWFNITIGISNRNNLG